MYLNRYYLKTTTIYFAGGSEDEHAKAVRAHAKKIKLADVTKL
jgi:hypothetical protein